MVPPEAPSITQETKIWIQLEKAVQESNAEETRAILSAIENEEQTRAISRLSIESRRALADTLAADEFAQLLKELPQAQAAELLENLSPAQTAKTICQLPPEIGGQLLRQLDENKSSKILSSIGQTSASVELQARLNYEEGSAGSLMRGAPVTFSQSATVQDVLDDLYQHAEDYADRDVQYLYVVDEAQRLTGVLQLRQLLWSPKETQIKEFMVREPLVVSDKLDFHELASLFESRPFLGLPVVDDEEKLLGVVPRDAVQRETSNEQTEQYLQSQGIIDGEELRSMPTLERCRKRLAWLAPNILLNLAAASVIAANEKTLKEVIALAVFLPIVSDMSGCSGNQAVAVSIRELTLGVIRPRDFIRVIVKEGLVGIINGTLLGLLLGTVAGIWKGNFFLGAVVAASLALNTVLSVLLGGLVPLVLKSRKVDPALASGPILTTCTDMCGFFLVLSLASMMIEKLT